MPGIRNIVAEGPQRFRVVAESDMRGVIAARLVGQGANLQRLAVVEPSLDDIYERYFANNRAAA
jgi:ABC-2 type transport system ATP-binding protein